MDKDLIVRAQNDFYAVVDVPYGISGVIIDKRLDVEAGYLTDGDPVLYDGYEHDLDLADLLASP